MMRIPSYNNNIFRINPYLRRTLRGAYLKFFGNILPVQKGIHILNAHYVQTGFTDIEKDTKIFEMYLENLKDIGSKFIRIEEATKYVTSKNPLHDKCYIAFTFDDGYEEEYVIIAPILERYNTNAAFFINSNYISSSFNYQQSYNKRVALNTKKPMTWKHVIDLHHRGHIIGGHTLDHYMLNTNDNKEIFRQIVEDKKNIEDRLGKNCNYFAWPYGNSRYLSKEALDICLNYYKYIFNSDNWHYYMSFNNKVINRRHIEPFWPKSHIRYFLSKKLKYE